LTSTLRPGVDFDGNLDVRPTVDLDVRRRPQIIFVSITTTLVNKVDTAVAVVGLFVPSAMLSGCD
jgi:hypothetical protein